MSSHTADAMFGSQELQGHARLRDSASYVIQHTHASNNTHMKQPLPLLGCQQCAEPWFPDVRIPEALHGYILHALQPLCTTALSHRGWAPLPPDATGFPAKPRTL